jgi:hypothetical protein
MQVRPHKINILNIIENPTNRDPGIGVNLSTCLLPQNRPRLLLKFKWGGKSG